MRQLRSLHAIMRTFPSWLFLVYVLVGVWYVVSVPPFESPDEPRHFAVADYIQTQGKLPIQQRDVETRFGQEGSQPPLYYLLVAALIAPFDRSDLDDHLTGNPHAIIGDPNAPGNRNAYAHARVYPPLLEGSTLALFCARLFSLLLGTVTVAAVWQTARLLAPERQGLALLAAGLTAFNPQFLFISASVNNDTLVTALGSLLIWQTLQLLHHGFQPRRNLTLALLLALVSITKLSGLLFAPPLLLTAFWSGWRQRDRRGLLRFIFTLAVVWLLFAGWWYARNLHLYGELTGTQMMLDIFGRRGAPSLAELLGEEFNGLRISYWGLFGWFNVFTLKPFYRVMDIVMLAGAVGVLAWMWQRRAQRAQLLPILLLALQLALMLGGLIVWTSQTAATQGRLLFPVIAAISSLIALGLRNWRLPARAAIVALGSFAIAVPIVSIRPAYQPPVVVARLPESATPLYARFDDIEVLGYEMEVRRYVPGEAFPITLYWRAIRPSELDYSLFLDLLAADAVITQLPTWPGYGSLSTSRWQAGKIYQDQYQLLLPADLAGSSTLRLHFGWWKYPEEYRLQPVDAQGVALQPIILEAGAYVATDEADYQPAQRLQHPREFDGIRLLGYSLAEQQLILWWEATAPLIEDYHILVHVLAEEYSSEEPNHILAQGDAPPQLPTHFWRVGERFLSQHLLRLTGDTEVGRYPLYVGWYSTSQPLRLETECPDNSCWVTDILLPAAAVGD